MITIIQIILVVRSWRIRHQKTKQSKNIIGKLLWSTYLGGSAADNGYGIAVDSDNDILITGPTNSLDFPTVNAYDYEISGGGDGFITKFSFRGLNGVTIDPLLYWVASLTMFTVVLVATGLWYRRRKLHHRKIKIIETKNIDSILRSLSGNLRLRDKTFLSLIYGVREGTADHDESFKNEISDELLKFKYLLHPVRLLIMKVLSIHDMLPTAKVREMVGVNWNDFGNHLKSLQEKGYVEIAAQFNEEGKAFQIVSINEFGRQEFASLNSVLDQFANHESPIYIMLNSEIDAADKKLYPKN